MKFLPRRSRSVLLPALLGLMAGGVVFAAEPPVTETGCAVEGIAWRPVRLEGVELMPDPGGEPDRRPFIRFDEANKRAEGFAGCNRFSGGYTLEDESLKFGPLATTRMACPPAEEAMEKAFLGALAVTTELRVTDTELRLLAGDKAVAEFRAP